MFKKIMLIILAACELFLCYAAFFKKDKLPDGGGTPITSSIELPERFMTDKERALYRQTVEALRKVSIGEADYYPVTLELSEPFESEEELDAAADKVEYFVERYVPEYTYWLDSLYFYGMDFEQVYLYFYVSPEYQSDYDFDDFDDDYDYDEYDFIETLGYIPAEKLETAQRALDNAKKIVAKYEGKSDYEKVLCFVEEICALNVYNDEAADADDDYDLISPWRIVNIFDGDPQTNSVCMGYAQALVYLCGLSGIECHYMSGTMHDGAHGWNMVVLNGVNYYVDVTSCDTIGYSDAEIRRYHPFILLGVAESGPVGFERNYISRKGAYYSAEYKYGDDTIKYMPEETRLLSKKSYPSKRRLYILMGAGLVGIIFCALPKRKRAETVSNGIQAREWGGDL